MRWSTLQQRELLDISSGNRLGRFHQADCVIDDLTGRIKEIILPPRRSWWNLFRKQEPVRIPWHRIRKVGNDFILLEQGEPEGP